MSCISPDVEDEPKPDESPVDALVVERAEIPTVLWVRWRTAEPTVAVVRGTFGPDTLRVEEVEPNTEHAVLLAGIPENTVVQVEVELPGEAPALAVITTGNLPAWLPDLTFLADVPEAAAGGFTIAGVIELDGGGVVVVDHAGRAVWAHEAGDDLRGVVSRARMSRDGNAILYGSGAVGADAPGAVVRVPLDGSAVTSTPAPGTHTDFVELPTGGFALLGWDVREFEGRKIAGDTIVEVGLDGVTRVVWSVFDDFSPDLTLEYPHQYPGDPDAEDWTHINGLAYDADEDDYYVTMTWNDGIARIDRGTGGLVWSLTDEGGDFERIGDRRLVHQPHSVERTPEGLLVFNRGAPQVASTCSEATEIALDEGLGTAETVRAYTSERCLLVSMLGSAAWIPGGNMLVSWTTAGQLDEVTPDGELAWRVNTQVGFGFGFAERVPTLGDGRP